MSKLKYDPQAGRLVRDPKVFVSPEDRLHTLREVAELVAEAIIPEDFRIFPETAADGTMIQYKTARGETRQTHWINLLGAINERRITAVSLTTRTPHTGRSAELGDLDRLGLTRDQLIAYCAIAGITVEETKARRPVKPAPKDASPDLNWKMRIQAEATRRCLEQRRYGAQPSKSSLSKEMPRWCREQGIRTSPGGIFPSEPYIRTHVLGKDWSLPPE